MTTLTVHDQRTEPKHAKPGFLPTFKKNLTNKFSQGIAVGLTLYAVIAVLWNLAGAIF